MMPAQNMREIQVHGSLVIAGWREDVNYWFCIGPEASRLHKDERYAAQDDLHAVS